MNVLNKRYLVYYVNIWYFHKSRWLYDLPTFIDQKSIDKGIWINIKKLLITYKNWLKISFQI